MRTAREAAGGEAARVDIRFRRGVPDALNAIEMSIADLVGSLGTIAAAHGGTPDQAPAVAAHLALQQAQTAVRRLGAEPEVDRFTDTVSRQYADLIDAGLWFSPLRRALDAFVDAVQDTASGLVHLRLFRGQVESAADRLPADPLAVVSVKG